MNVASTSVGRRAVLESESLSWIRRFAAWIGLGGLCMLAVAADSPAANTFANLIIAPLGIAAVFGFVEAVRGSPRVPAPRLRASVDRASGRSAVLIVAIVSAVASQTWFQPGMAIAGGDVPPPNGTAWILRIVDPWTWSGSNLGGPSALEQQFPWALVLGLVHVAGGSAELAQRLWYVAFFTAAAIASAGLLLALGARPIGTIIGSLAYSFSPFVVANVVPNPVLIVALALLPALPAVVLLGAKGRIHILTAVLLLGASAPLFGIHLYQSTDARNRACCALD